MTTAIETIREALTFNKNYLLTKHNMGSEQRAKVRLECSHMLTEATIALDRIEGRCLPELPEEWRLMGLGGIGNDYDCAIGRGFTKCFGSGTTPSVAVQSALSKIPPAKTGSDEKDYVSSGGISYNKFFKGEQP